MIVTVSFTRFLQELYRGKNVNAVCFHAEIFMSGSPYPNPDPSKAELVLEPLHKQPSITS